MMMSACGVICSDCPAYLAATKGRAFQNIVVEAWQRIYGLDEKPEQITCAGCLGSDEALFYTSRNCAARQCCKSKGYANCAECMLDNCPELDKAQSVWDGVPNLQETLSQSDFATYAQPYCYHRQRLAAARTAKRRK